jgi:cobalt transporter subunit CbtB
VNAQSPSRLSTSDVRAHAAPIAALLLGGFLVLMVGFSPMQSVHNAAHDTRHSAAFPCH